MDQKPTYSVEDILLEYELKKRGQADVPKAATERFGAAEHAEPKTPPKTAFERFGEAAHAPTPTPRKPIAIAPAGDEEEEDIKIAPESPSKKEKTKELPVVKEAGYVAPSVAKKKESDTRPLAPLRPVPPEEKKTVAINTRTRVLTVEQSEEKYDTQELNVPTQLEGQMVMEDFDTAPIDEEALEEELRRRRMEKVNGFRIVEGGKPAFKLTGDEEQEAEDDEELLPDPEDDEELEDFNDYAEADAIRSELTYRCRTSAFAMIATLVMGCMLVLLTAAYQFRWLTEFSPEVLIVLHLVLLVGMLGVNHRMVAGGIKNLFTMRADADTPAAISGVIGVIYTAAQLAVPQEVASGEALFLSAVAAAGIAAGSLGRQMRLIRIRRSFAFVGNEKLKKYAASFLSDEKIAAELGQPAGIDGVPPIVYYRSTTFMKDYLKTSYAQDPTDKVMRWFVPLVLGVSLACAVGYGLLFPAHARRAPAVFAATALTALPVWALYGSQRTMTRACKHALKKGAMIGGWDAVEQFGRRTKAVILDAGELFPKEQIKLHGIKTFSGTRIDEAITDAAAVVIAAGGPLAPIFQRLIENRTDILREVDSLAYEQDMGLSGWVGGRRVLIGNRRLLENHGVDVPSKEYEERYTNDGRNTVYLSTGGELSAMFVVSYLANEEIKQRLRTLQKSGVDLLIRTCDPNITAELVCRVMDLPPLSAEVLTAGEGRAYERLLRLEGDQPSTAMLACTGRAVSKLTALVQCRRLRYGVWLGLFLQLSFSVAALGTAVFVTSVTGLVLRADAMLGFVLLSALVSRLAVRFTRV